MRTRSLLVLALILVAAGCGQTRVTFTAANWGTLMANPPKYEGAKVDVVGQVFLVDNETPGVVWVGIYADPKGLTWETIVKLPSTDLLVDEGESVHIVGKIDQALQKPESMRGFDVEPVVLADKATLTAAKPL